MSGFPHAYRMATNRAYNQEFAATAPFYVSAGDVNGDGKPDIVTTNYGSNTVSVILGNGDGTFQARQDLATGTNPKRRRHRGLQWRMANRILS